MNRNRKLSLIFGLTGLLLALFAVGVIMTRLDAVPVLATMPTAAGECAESLMEDVCGGDFLSAQEKLYGTPNLGADREPADDVGQLIWDAYTDSLEYEFVGDYYATDTGIARDVVITALDLASVTENLGSRSQQLLEHRVEKAEDVSQIYDENNEYREDFVMTVLFDAAYQSLKEDARTARHEVTLNLVFRQGQWWVLPDSALLSAISGGTAG